MQKIPSFQVNHNYLTPGLYTSRVDDDIVTYDLRTCRPNAGAYLENDEIHTFEHLFATYIRNTPLSKHIIYFGPMGCRTGFYLIVRDLSPQTTIELVQRSLEFIAEYQGEIPGCSERECGNATDHSLPKAKELAKRMLPILAGWAAVMLEYTYHEPRV